MLKYRRGGSMEESTKLFYYNEIEVENIKETLISVCEDLQEGKPCTLRRVEAPHPRGYQEDHRDVARYGLRG